MTCLKETAGAVWLTRQWLVIVDFGSDLRVKHVVLPAMGTVSADSDDRGARCGAE